MDFYLLDCLFYSRDRLRLRLTVKNISFLHVKNYVTYGTKPSGFSTVFRMNTTQLEIKIWIIKIWLHLLKQIDIAPYW